MVIMKSDATTRVQCLALVVHTLIILRRGVTASTQSSLGSSFAQSSATVQSPGVTASYHSSSGATLSPSSAPQSSSTAQSPAVTASSQSSPGFSFPQSSPTVQSRAASYHSSSGISLSPSSTLQPSSAAQSPAVTASSQSSSGSSFPHSSPTVQSPSVTASYRSSSGVPVSPSSARQPSSAAQSPAVTASSQSSSGSSFPHSSPTVQPPSVTASYHSSSGVPVSPSSAPQPSSTAQTPGVTASNQPSPGTPPSSSATSQPTSTAQPPGVTTSNQSSPGVLSPSATPQPSPTAHSPVVTASSQSSSESSSPPSVIPQSSSTPQPSVSTQSLLRISPSPSGSVSSDVTSTVPAYPTSVLSETKPSPSPTRFLLPSSSVTAIPPPEAYIEIYFSMPWGRFCYLISLFKESLSRKLLEFKGVQWHYVPLERIILYNAKEKCSRRTLYHNKDAILELFIAKTEEQRPKHTDTEMTEKAFHLLYGYWTNKRMILLDKVFEGKVSKVVYVGGKLKKETDEYTEAQRIGIAIGVALAVIAFILIVIYFIRGYTAVRQVGRKKDGEKIVFTNEHAFEEDSRQSESQSQTPEEPQQVVVHSEPSPPQTEKSESVATVEDTTPLLSTIKDYEDGKRGNETKSDKSDKETDETDEPLAKPEPDDSEGKPIKPPRSDSMIDADIVIPEQTLPSGEVPVTDEKVKNEEEGTEPDETDEEGKEKRSPTFTSSVTINITPEAATISREFGYPETEQTPAPEKEDSSQTATGGEPSGEEKAKPDFGQLDSGDVEPNEGAINLGFDEDEAPKKEKEEETKF